MGWGYARGIFVMKLCHVSTGGGHRNLLDVIKLPGTKYTDTHTQTSACKTK